MSKQITTENKAVCRFILENATKGVGADISNVGALTVARAADLRLKRLADGSPDAGRIADGDYQRLGGLGVKWGEEAIRLGIPAAT